MIFKDNTTGLQLTKQTFYLFNNNDLCMEFDHRVVCIEYIHQESPYTRNQYNSLEYIEQEAT